MVSSLPPASHHDDNHHQQESSSSPPAALSSTPNIQAEEILIRGGQPVERLAPHHALRGVSLGERIHAGRTLLKLRHLVSPDEVQTLLQAVLEAAQERKQLKKAEFLAHRGTAVDDDDDFVVLDQGYRGKVFVRLLTQAAAEREHAPDDAMPTHASQLMEQILQRALLFLDQHACPSLRTTLFAQQPASSNHNTHHSTTTAPDVISIAQLFRDNQLQYSVREPAINVYDAPHGHFAMHKDNQALSILVPLSASGVDFDGGGGTAFWSQSSPVSGLDRPSLILQPTPGTALLWGGRVSHQGLPFAKGTRVVLVASFSGPQGPPGGVQDRFSGGGLGLKTVWSGR